MRGSWLGSLLLGIGVAACNTPSARQGDGGAVDGGADASVAAAAPAEPRVLDRSRPEERSLAPPAQDRWQLAMGQGESCDVVVTQEGIDLVVDVLAPGGKRLTSVDSPNGRQGDEPAEIVATAPGLYEIVVRALENGAPAGRYRIAVKAFRDAAATAAWQQARAEVRAAASAWLAARAGSVRAGEDGSLSGPGLERFDRLAAERRVIGLGEATHGSRQIADLRLALTRRLVERSGVRVIGLEASAARMRNVDRWTRRPDAADAELADLLGRFWINRRVFLALAVFARDWNTKHPADPVRMVGLDDQDNAPARAALSAFVARAYEASFAARVNEVLARIARADTQAAVFGPSDVTAGDWRFLRQLHGSLEARRPLLSTRLGETAVDDALAASRTLLQFAEYNSGADDEPSYSRDWTMAANLLRALGPATRAVYWGHNAHAAHPDRKGDGAPTGTLLLRALPGQYAALAVSFFEGGFLAQLPNDPGDRLQTFLLPPADGESLDAVLAAMALGDAIATWPEGAGPGLPAWLTMPQPMHWIGALYAADTPPNQASRAYDLVGWFDAVAFLQKVDAETSDEIGKNRAP